MRDVVGRLWTKMEVHIEDGRPPFVCGVLADERRHDSRDSERLEEFTAIHHKSS